VGVTLARIVRPQGRRGEVAAEILTDFPTRLATLREAYLWDGSSEPRCVAIRSCWLQKNRAIFHFAGCECIADAERLRGLDVQVPLADRAPLPAGRYYVSDLVGCEVWERGAPHGTGGKVGTVRDVQFTGKDIGGTPLLVLETAQGELLIPLAEEICTCIDTPARRIEVLLPDGLHDLNLP
jgi:16S rRNA processing protein RimM